MWTNVRTLCMVVISTASTPLVPMSAAVSTKALYSVRMDVHV